MMDKKDKKGAVDVERLEAELVEQVDGLENLGPGPGGAAAKGVDDLEPERGRYQERRTGPDPSPQQLVRSRRPHLVADVRDRDRGIDDDLVGSCHHRCPRSSTSSRSIRTSSTAVGSPGLRGYFLAIRALYSASRSSASSRRAIVASRSPPRRCPSSTEMSMASGR